MENVTYAVDQDILTIGLAGHIDSGNASEVESCINEIREGHPAEHIVMDCGNLKYISSAGLRIILRVKKKVKDTRITEVSNEVYEVLEMTGFTELMDVKKAYRVISVEGCEVIGEGANGRVYRIDKDTIVKVYLNPDALPEIQRERELARTAFVKGVPTAIPYDVVRIEGGGYGSVFELLNAQSFINLLKSGEKTLDEIAEMSIELLKIIHSTVVEPGSMPDMKQVALDWASYLKDYLPEAEGQKLYSLIEAVPDDNHLMHGDYHLKNIMLQDGESLLIDMDTLCYGYPVFEFASMFNAYGGFAETDHNRILKFMGIPYEEAVEFLNKSLKLYFDGADDKKVREVKDKARIIGYARMMRRCIRRNGFDTEAGKKEIENCRTNLIDLLSRVDTLVF